MTGTRFSLRRYGGCNLHVYAPLPHHSPQFSRERRERTRLERLARTRLHVPDDQADSADGIDRYGPWVWMSTGDCLWDWLANRPFMYVPALAEPLYRLHEHVHTPHDHPERRYVFFSARRALVRLTRSTWLDERLDTDVFPDAHAYRVTVRLPASRDHQTEQIVDLIFNQDGVEDPTGHRSTHPRLGPTFSWIERASAPHRARTRAQVRLAELHLLGGSAWEAPVKEDA